MNIKISKEYFSDTKWAALGFIENTQGGMILIKEASTYSKLEMENWVEYMTSIGYLVIDKYKKRSKNYVLVARVVPDWQRLVNTSAFIIEKMDDGTEKRVQVKVDDDIILYTDEDLRLMRDWKKVDKATLSKVVTIKNDNGVNEEYTIYPNGDKVKLEPFDLRGGRKFKL